MKQFISLVLFLFIFAEVSTANQSCISEVQAKNIMDKNAQQIISDYLKGFDSDALDYHGSLSVESIKTQSVEWNGNINLYEGANLFFFPGRDEMCVDSIFISCAGKIEILQNCYDH